MSWLRVDDKFARHHKIMPLSDKAFRLHVAAMCNCADMLTDGRVTERDVKMLCPVIAATTWKRYVNELVHAGLWSVENHGWTINDYLEYNPSSVKVKEARERHARNQARYRSRDRSSDRSSASVPSPTPVNTKNQDHVGPLDLGANGHDEEALAKLYELSNRIGRNI